MKEFFKNLIFEKKNISADDKTKHAQLPRRQRVKHAREAIQCGKMYISLIFNNSILCLKAHARLFVCSSSPETLLLAYYAIICWRI